MSSIRNWCYPLALSFARQLRRGVWRALKVLPWLTHCAIATLVLTLFWQEWAPQDYEFPPPRPFVGSQWYNPYQGLSQETSPEVSPLPASYAGAAVATPELAVAALSDAEDSAASHVASTEVPSVQWLRACFHTHSKAWGGLTDGSHSAGQVVDAYRRRNYDLVGVSNYHSIRPRSAVESLYLECYEHGYGVGQHHFTVIGSAAVSWREFPLYKRLQHKQELIDRLGEQAELLVINHPNRAEAYSLEDMKQLVGYDGIEVATRYADGRKHWDEALTAGRRVWGFCGDDAHNFSRYAAYARGWVCLAAHERSREGVLRALREGRFYGVWNRRYEVRRNRLLKCEVEDGVIHIVMERPVDVIRIYSQTGIIRKDFNRTREARYTIRGDDPYVRIEAILKDKWSLDGSTYFLNPIYRHEGDPHRRLSATVNEASTATRRLWACGGLGIALLGHGTLIFGLRRRRLKRRLNFEG